MRASLDPHDDAISALARLYAIESGQPEISRTKLEGLAAHYGIESGPGTDYFTVHRGRDVEHAAEGRELLGRCSRPIRLLPTAPSRPPRAR